MIEAVGLKKTYPGTAKGQPVQALKSVSFTCRQGQVLGLIGPNGAGKTTTLRILSGAITATDGEVRVKGLSLMREHMAARRQIGFLSGHTGLYLRLSVRENIEYFGRAYGLRGAALRARSSELIEQLGLQQYADQLVDKLSFGNKQRAAIARTVVHTPEILILDEPTTGLDILGAKLVNDFVREYKRSGAAIIFSTHHMHEVEELCDEICIINNGVSAFQGALPQLLSHTGTSSLHGAYLHTVTATDTSV
ncbi:ATP-binding cassette domain-containing protein [Pseudoduganella sp. FT93W]|uniref:ATP-binding cassette domain-containing protein n=1 Tax=Duganella fentianensis TaxID=2692177 RepID=A0A845HZ44_9BURK|nr:ABC transporter ATP-binding protein [Duganella fentianensis]MYN46634.1 ATP-binding cassette domain-containing protein [Duganella fentianensis]